MNVTVCNGTNAEISCGFTGVYYPPYTIPNWSWRIVKRNNDGYIISNKTVRVADINANRTDGLAFVIITTNMNGIINADRSYLSVGPVDDTYNNTSYQCIFAINDTTIESDTAGTITVIGKYNAKQKQPGCKKSERPIRSHNGYKRPKPLISSKAKKLNILLRILLLE